LKSVFIIFGILNINEAPKIYLTAEQFFIHPQYNAQNLNNDISIIKLPKPVPFSNTIKPIPLVSRSQENDLFVGKTAMVTGWGFTSDEELEFSPDLLFAKVSVITNQECELTFGKDYIKDSNMCAKGSKIESICNGDSGGALVLENSPGDFIQIGINSFVADQICAEGFPAGFVRLGAFLDYIKQTTGLLV